MLVRCAGLLNQRAFPAPGVRFPRPPHDTDKHLWRNRETRRFERPVAGRPCRFESCQVHPAGVAELEDAHDPDSCARRACRFESCHPHSDL